MTQLWESDTIQCKKKEKLIQKKLKIRKKLSYFTFSAFESSK